MVDATYVTGSAVAVAGSTIEFEHTITLDGAAVDLTGKTVTASVRRSWVSGVISDGAEEEPETLDGLAVTLGAAPDDGDVDWQLEPEESALLEPYCPPDGVTPALFHLQYFVTEDDYYPQVFRFYVRRAGG